MFLQLEKSKIGRCVSRDDVDSVYRVHFRSGLKIFAQLILFCFYRKVRQLGSFPGHTRVRISTLQVPARCLWLVGHAYGKAYSLFCLYIEVHSDAIIISISEVLLV